MDPAPAPAEAAAPPPRRRKEALLLLALLATVAAPFLLQTRDTAGPAGYDRRLVILSPHNERVRQEFGHAFARLWQERTGEHLYVDWRIPGGATEIAMFLRSEYSGAFQHEWEYGLGRPWTAAAGAFANPRVDPAGKDEAGEARRRFLESGVGIGVDLLFGGGSYDFQQHADAGYLVAGSAAPPAGLRGVMALHPDWFRDSAIPGQVGGEPFRDPEARWSGVVLAGFGIVYNRDVLRRLRISREPAQWDDLADPRLLGQVALADPTKSGSVAKAFELMVQQQMHRAVAELQGRNPAEAPANIEAEGIRRGWDAGLRLILRISANARYFTDSASKIPQEVARGDAAAGMAIDSYGRFTEEYVRGADGQSRVGFVAPAGGTSVSVDPIGMLRGAPEPEIATAFMEFVLSPEGQKLWAFRPGTPGGPATAALRRLPVRRDFYTAENRQFMADAREEPYARAEYFHYRADWTGPVFGVLRFLIRVACVDTHQEQKDAWRALIEHGFPPAAVAEFEDLGGAGHEDALTRIAPVLRARDKAAEVRLARELADGFRARYRRAAELARAAAPAGLPGAGLENRQAEVRP
jgi:ABC-type Fe3+ transport system substrate-binding protein